MNGTVQYLIYLVILVAMGIPLGAFIKKVMYGEKTFLSPVLKPCEKGLYKLLKIDSSENMTGKKYTLSVLFFSGIGLLFVTLIQMLQGFLPFNPQDLPNVSWDLSFNTAASFITNTNWQSYTGEAVLSYLSQFLGLTVQNFVSAATGIAVLFALIRGFTQVKDGTLGSFWVDMIRIVLYILIPLNFIISILLVAGGVIQNFKPGDKVQLLEPIAITEDGEIIENAVIDKKITPEGLVSKDSNVYVTGEDGNLVLLPDAHVVTEQFIPMGPGASQISIKQSGTNGGGFMGVNSAHPMENPSPFTNLLEMISLLLIPVALCFTFGRAVKNKKQGFAIFTAMFLMLSLALAVIAINEQKGTPQLKNDGAVNIGASSEPMLEQAGGNMEGKESRFGIATSSTWSAFTTAASNGSVNSMHDSSTPIGGMIEMVQMQLGEVIFGGVGCGLYGMLGFAILTVFIAGLMVGRTPEFLGKKIEPYEMKWAVVLCLATPFAILVGSGIAVMVPSVSESLLNSGAHGFSEILYTFSSCAGNNGSAFAGFNGNTLFLNVTLGLIMLFVRFIPIVAVIAIAESLGKKKTIAATAGTLSTTNEMFVFLLIFIVLLVGALSFLPALALGPLAEFFTQMV